MKTLDLFPDDPAPPPAPKPVRVISPEVSQAARVLQAAREGAVAMTATADRAEKARPGWQDDAYRMLCAFANVTFGDFLVEEIRSYAVKNGLDEPPDARAWGAVVQRAIRSRIVVYSGSVARAASSHGTLKPKLRSTMPSDLDEGDES